MSLALGFGGAAEGGGAAAAASAGAAAADDEPSVFKRMSTAVGGAADAVQAAVANVTGSDDAEGPIKKEGQCLRDGPSCHSAAAYAALAGGAPLAVRGRRGARDAVRAHRRRRAHAVAAQSLSVMIVNGALSPW